MRGRLPIIAMLVIAMPPALARTEPAGPADRPAKVKKICRTQMPTGRRISESICHSPAEWDQIDAANGTVARRVINQLTQQGSTTAESPAPVPTP